MPFVCVLSFNAACSYIEIIRTQESQKHINKNLTGRKKNRKEKDNNICYYLLGSLRGKDDKVIKIKTC